MNPPRIYLAGPDLFYPDAEARYATLKALCAQHGLVGVAPTDDAPDVSFEAGRVEAQALYRHDIALLRSCNAVLANITPHNGPFEADPGTAYEMGFAAALGIPVVSYCTDGMDTCDRVLRAGRQIDDGWRNDDGMLVEDFGLPANLMLCAEHEWFSTPEEAVEHLASVLGGQHQQALDEQQVRRLIQRGAAAWKDVPKASEWVDLMRGNDGFDPS